MRAISDINGLDIKNHNDDQKELVRCLRAWFSDTVRKNNLPGSEHVFASYLSYQSALYDKKMRKYLNLHREDGSATKAEAFAEAEIEEMTTREFIDEVKAWMRVHKTIDRILIHVPKIRS